MLYYCKYDYHLSLSPNILDRWFESDLLQATLATDAVVGAMLSPHSVGSGSVKFFNDYQNILNIQLCTTSPCYG